VPLALGRGFAGGLNSLIRPKNEHDNKPSRVGPFYAVPTLSKPGVSKSGRSGNVTSNYSAFDSERKSVSTHIYQKLVRIGRRLNEIGKDIAYLSRVSTPPMIFFSYVKGTLRWRSRQRYYSSTDEFKKRTKEGRFSNDWFSLRLPHWLQAFEKTDFYERPIRALEIGSWQGMSSLFILATLPKAHLTCVDTWDGADEHIAVGSAYYTPDIGRIQADFDANLAEYRDRLTKFRGTSLEYYASTNSETPQFDLIYVDGSHHSDDVIIDALECFSRLKLGGLMILDDYLFRYYQRETDNPAAAINWFLKQKSGFYELISANWQLVIKKIDHKTVSAVQ
jgi:hypothetical protein